MRLIFFLLVGICLFAPLWGQTFRCDGRLILGTNNEALTQTYAISFAPFFVISYNPISSYIGNGFDALGFNPKDNYIYAVRENTNTIVRLKSDGSFETLGPVPIVDQLEVYAGDCTPDGRYLCHDNTLDQILVFTVVDGFVLEDRLDLFWDPSSVNSGPFTTRLDDFAINPNNPTVAYAFQATGNFDPDLLPLTTGGYLLEINLDFTDADVGMVTPIAPVTSNLDITRLGSLFFNDFGGLYGYGAQNTGPNSSENRLVAINPQTAEAFPQGGGGPPAPATDGCSCPYSLKVNYSVAPLVATCTGSEVTYMLTINNRSFEALSAVTLSDTVAEGMIIEAIDGDFMGNIDPTTGVGTRFLTINEFQIPARGTVEMSITARIIDVPVGNVTSQVHLSNLPPLFDEERISDDPTTSNINDPAIFAADAQFLENVALDITPPSDCLSDNDGQVVLSSPLFLPGVAYQIGLLNEDWEPFAIDVIVDSDNSFLLDSMASGEYRLDQVRPENTLCSYEWKDTTIIIEAPNEQLQASIQSNSPVCEGENLQLSALLSPGGSVNWNSPLFTFNDLSIVWEEVGPEYSGVYEMTATYGACEQIREMEVMVEPAIDASITGAQEYCERVQMQLLAEGVGDSLTFQWSGPNNLMDTSRLIELAAVAPEDGGTYQVIIDNDACQDTSTIAISILPSPTIEMPKVIEDDFCDPITLQPIITGDTDVIYTWTPSEGLSCSDCPNPEIQIPILPSYQLHVINDTLCTDSAMVRVYFRGDDLIYIPNAFSPNFDGVNDNFQLFPSCVVSMIKELAIYDRWGNLVFSAGPINPADPREFWNGQVNGKVAETGVYLWQTEIELINGTSRTLAGEVYLLR